MREELKEKWKEERNDSSPGVLLLLLLVLNVFLALPSEVLPLSSESALFSKLPDLAAAPVGFFFLTARCSVSTSVSSLLFPVRERRLV